MKRKKPFDALSKLTEEIRRAGINFPISYLVGKKFIFHCEFGSHTVILLGQIMGVRWSDEGGLQLYVSVPKMRGKLESLVHINGIWNAEVNLGESPGYPYHPETLELL